jgi:metal-responsive CopG/Arc/MetJ family transcriptional regulator
MHASEHKRGWTTVKIPDDLTRVVDKHVSTLVDGVRVYDSRSGFIRSVLLDYFERIRQEKGNFANTHIKQEGIIRAR